MPKAIPESKAVMPPIDLKSRWSSMLDPYLQGVDFTQLTDQDQKKIQEVLAQNADKNFVQRIITPNKYPVMQQPDGSVATHKMSWSTVGGVPTVYPLVVQDPKKKELKEFLNHKEAIEHAMETGEYIQFKTPQEAEWFSKNYKKAWEPAYKTPQFRADGGPVAAGEPYIVGENGPELIVPDANGVVLNPKTTQEWRQGEQSLLERIKQAVSEKWHSKITASIGDIDAGDSLKNEKVYKALRGIPEETYRLRKFTARGAIKAREQMGVRRGLQGWYDPEAHEVVTLKEGRSPEYTTMHEMTHARTYGSGIRVSQDEKRDNAEVRKRSRDETYRNRTEEQLANAVARRLTPYVESPYLKLTQEMFDRAYLEELNNILKEKRAAGKKE